MPGRVKFAKRCFIGLLLLTVGTGLAMVFSPRSASGRESDDRIIAPGAGTTIIHGGTGSPGFVPVTTTVAFHAERSNGGAAGEFDCLAFAPEATTGPHSGQLTINVMYVVGKITGVSLHQNAATLTGVADITGLGAGTNVPFTFFVHRGGPGAAAILTVNSLTFPFNEILVQSAFEVHDQD